MNRNPDPEKSPIMETDKLIHEPARASIMAVLNVSRHVDFVFLINHTGLTQGNLSSHLSKLEAAGYIEITKTFHKKRPRTIIQISKSGKTAFSSYIKNMRAFLDGV